MKSVEEEKSAVIEWLLHPHELGREPYAVEYVKTVTDENGEVISTASNLVVNVKVVTDGENTAADLKYTKCRFCIDILEERQKIRC